ncbi:MAG: hypothetical protein QGG36_21565 [Pirellulaceae bacterium]|nr:hypothetical protein [Pirellulaceae bacterium]MDP7018408.1 hypothetical protein [Pirellulaceae bacterium]
MSVRLRMTILLSVILTMPVMALPPVGDWLDRVLYGASPTEYGFEPALRNADSVEQGERTTNATAIRPRSLGSPASSDDRLRAIQQRLQVLGATYMILESYGQPDLTYRFYCRVEDDRAGQAFERRDVDPVRAMEQLLRDVEVWTASRQTPPGHQLR